MTGEDAYLRRWTKLKRATVKGRKAPHKPVLLLAVLDSLDAGEITGPEIFITPELVARFRDRWAALVPDPGFSPNFSLPFYHLTGDGFWHLRMRPGKEIVLTSSLSIRSFAQLRECVWYAAFDAELAALLYSAVTRERFRQALLVHYFGAAAGSPTLPAAVPGGLFATAEAAVLGEAPVAYGAPAADEETAYVRGAAFKRVVPREYGYTCCISGTRVTSTTGAQLIDACHILPFAETGDDSIGNGLALCPNLHRAFDRGLIGVDADYRVRVAAVFSEAPDGYAIKPLKGRRILLPANREYWPRVENLAGHLERWKY